jgi:hypothetical protein
MEHLSCRCDKVLGSCLQANFHLEYDTAQCPHKHDLGMSVPNEFSFLPAGVLVVGVFRCRVLSSSLIIEIHNSGLFLARGLSPRKTCRQSYARMPDLMLHCCRNAFDWAASMHRHPWHAPNHCNTSSFAEFLLREWSPGKLAGSSPCSSNFFMCSDAC